MQCPALQRMKQLKHAQQQQQPTKQQQLRPRAQNRAQHVEPLREPKHVAVQHLPADLLGVVALVAVLRSGAARHQAHVLAHEACEDGGEEDDEDEHADEGVEHGEPVDFDVAVVVRVLVLVGAPRVRKVCLFPSQAIAHLELQFAAVRDLNFDGKSGRGGRLDDLVAVDCHQKVDVRVHVEPRPGHAGVPRCQGAGHFADEEPHR
mmetsp:Transcript_15577/g.39862  ORF Transcript_15577/g.39862 Transcript_15577/m.39862 type:complete len:205 (-) Transcript_15577:524-1138(-)